MDNLLWVVYTTITRANPNGIHVVCEQGEWDALELSKPGQQTLVQGGIASEGEAERLARGTSGDPVKRKG